MVNAIIIIKKQHFLLYLYFFCLCTLYPTISSSSFNELIVVSSIERAQIEIKKVASEVKHDIAIGFVCLVIHNIQNKLVQVVRYRRKLPQNSQKQAEQG